MVLAGLTATDPSQLGPFHLLGRLGSGGMGQVYLGRGATGGLAAIKVVHSHLATDPQFRARFAREIRTAALVTAPWIAAVVDADPDAARPWLATEYVTGAALDDVVDSTGPLSESAVLVVAARLAEALAALHAAGVVHRDLKPSNVLLAPDGPRLIDFGIAHAIDATKITHTGHVIGTPSYMSPEQALGSVTGPASDVFSLAAVLTFAATGAGPFGTATNPVVMLLRVTDHQPDLSRLTPGLRELLVPCFAKQPAARPSSQDLATRLAPRAAAVLGAGAGAEAPTTLLSPAARALLYKTRDVIADVDHPPSPGSSKGPPAPPRAQRRWRPWMSVTSALVAVVAIAAAVLLIAAPGSAPPAGTGATPSTSQPPTAPGQGRQVATLRVGTRPAGVTWAPDGARAFVRGSTGGDISVIDTGARAVAATIGVAGSPYGLAVSPDSKRLYILQLDGFVSVIDAATSAVIATVPVGKQPQGIALTPDGRAAYVPNQMDNTVSVIDTASNTVAATIPVGAGPQAVAATPDSRSVWVFSYDAKSLSVIDTATNAVGRTVAMDRAEHIAFTPDGATAYITGGILSAVTVLDVATLTKRGEVGDLGRTSINPVDVAVAPSGRYAFVLTAGTGTGDNAVRVVDTSSNLVVQVVALDSRPETMAVSHDGHTIYVASTDADSALIVDTAGFV